MSCEGIRHKRQFEVYRNGLLHTVVSILPAEMRSVLIAFTNQDPDAEWELQPYERRRTPDRRAFEAI
jgi:hypothetical protein